MRLTLAPLVKIGSLVTTSFSLSSILSHQNVCLCKTEAKRCISNDVDGLILHFTLVSIVTGGIVFHILAGSCTPQATGSCTLFAV